MRAAAELSVAVFGWMMRKKWLWLLVVPIVLCGAIFWAREVAWKKQEERFRVAMHEWLKYGAASTRVYPDDTVVFFDESADSLLQIDQMKLVPSATKRPQNKPLIFISMSSGDRVGEPWGFYLSRQGDRGWIEIPEPDVDKWNKYELSPDTCRALKKRILAFEQKERELVDPK